MSLKGEFEVRRCKFYANEATGLGGSLYIYGHTGYVYVKDSDLSDAVAPLGGGAYIEWGDPVFSNCRISGNYASSRGGGIYTNEREHHYIRASEIVGNDAGEAGGGVWARGSLIAMDSTFSNSEGGSTGIHVRDEIIFRCCDYEDEVIDCNWIIVQDEECEVANRSVSFSDLKRRFR